MRLTDEFCQISFPEADAGAVEKRDPLVVRVALHPGYRDRLQIGCNRSGDVALLHQGASVAMLLDEKTSLGLAGAPTEDTPWELLSEELLESRVIITLNHLYCRGDVAIYLLPRGRGNVRAYAGAGISCGRRGSATGLPAASFNGSTPARHLSA